MVAEVTLDSSVLVSALVEHEEHRDVARGIMKRVFDGDFRVATSAIVPVEVCGAIARVAGPAAAKRAVTQLQKWKDAGLFDYVYLTQERSEESAGLAIDLRVRGMDAIVIQAAKEHRSVLVTFDREMAKKAEKIIRIAEPGKIALGN